MKRVFRMPFSTRRSVERSVDEELSFHIAMRAAKLRRAGAEEHAASSLAVERFGDRERIRQECIDIDQQHAREERLMEMLETLAADFRYAFRTLVKRPTFTIVATLTLALGIGATSAIFSLVDGILLRPLPYPRADRLVQLRQSYPEKGLDDWSLSQENVAMYRDRMRAFESLAGYARRGATLDYNGHAEQLVAELVTGDFFTVMGVGPIVGRAFTRDDDRPNDNNVAILSDGFWQSHYAGDRGVVGKTIDLNGRPVRVIGILPPGFAFPKPDVQVFLPLGLDPTRKFGWFLTAVARLRPGATVGEARSEATNVMRDWAKQAPGLMPASVDPRATRMAALVRPLHTAITGDVARPLAVLQAAVVLILLIAIANVATLLSSRASARAREMAMRAALGATNGRIVRQLLTESVALASLGGAIGIALAFLLVRTFTSSSAVSVPRMGEVGVSWRVLAFTVVVTGVSGILFGLAPALNIMRQRLAGGLAGTKASAHGDARRMNNLLIVAQIGLSFVLLVSAGLVLKSFRHLLRTDLGFEPAGVTAVSMPLPMQKYMNQGRVVAFTSIVNDRIRALPGVEDAAIMIPAMFAHDVNTDGYLVEGHAPPATAGSETQTVTVSATPGLFRTLRMPLLYGRDFTASDDSASTPVVVVDEELAGRYWKGADAIGKRISLTGDNVWRTIVGVVGSVRDEDVAEAPRPHTYFPYAQLPSNRFTLMVRTRGDATAPLAAVRRAVTELDAGIPLDNIRPLPESIGHALDDRRLTDTLLTGFAVLAVLLAGIGLYGVMSLYVANRSREFGIRLAVGAEPVTLVRLVLREGVVLAVVGIALGAVAALLAARWIQALLYEVRPTDPLVFGLLAGLLVSIAAASCLVPARRAAKSDPLLVLRAD